MREVSSSNQAGRFVGVGNVTVVKTPFVRGFAQDRNKDGIVELVDYDPSEMVFAFRDGKFIKVSGKHADPG